MIPAADDFFFDLVAGAAGAAVGSWLNVIILRLRADRQWWRGRSACPHCGAILRWWEMVPVVSYIALGGRCRKCRQALAWQYLIVEIVSAAGFILVWRQFGFSWLLPAALAVTAAMILVAVYDARWALIPDSFSGLLVGASITAALLNRLPFLDMVIGGLGGGLVFAGQHVLSRRRWVGSGDIWLGLGLGLLLGWRALLLALFLAYMGGALVAMVLIAARKLKPSSTMPFGPYLMAAGFVTWLWGERLIDWYFRHPLFM